MSNSAFTKGVPTDFAGAGASGSVPDPSNDFSGASDEFVSQDLGRTITADWGTETRPTMAVASFDEAPTTDNSIFFGCNF